MQVLKGRGFSMSLLSKRFFVAGFIFFSCNTVVNNEVAWVQRIFAAPMLFSNENPAKILWEEELNADEILSLQTMAAGTPPNATLSAKKLSSKVKTRKSPAKNGPAETAEEFQVKSGYTPFFNAPALPPAWVAGDFVARNQEIVSQMTFTEAADKDRLVEIQQVRASFLQNAKKITESLQDGLKLLKLYEEHCTYLEYVRGMGLKDSRFNDLNATIRGARIELAKQSVVMQKTFSMPELKVQWKSLELTSRIKAGDADVEKDATDFIVNQRNTLGDRVMLTGLAWDFMAEKTKSGYGSLENGIEIATDDATKAALTLFLAENTSKTNAKLALKYFDEAARSSSQIKRTDGSLGPISTRASLKLVSTALKANQKAFMQDTVTALQTAGSIELARFYLERVALAQVPEDSGSAIKTYTTLQTLGELPPAINQKIETRKIDFAIASKNLNLAEQQWQSFLGAENFQKDPSINQKANQTLNLFQEQYTTGKKPADLQKLIKINDMFISKIFITNDPWNLKILKFLNESKNYAQVSQRGDELFLSSNVSTTKQQALNFSMQAKETLLGISRIPEMKPSKKISPSPILEGYFKNLAAQKDASFATPKEKSVAQFQMFYLTFITKGADASKELYEAALKIPGEMELKGKAFLMMEEFYEKQGRYLEAEAATRSAIAANLKLDKEQNLKAILERVVFAGATALAAQGKSEEAGDKFIKFKDEFPKSSLAEKSLENAVKQYRLSDNDQKLMTALKTHLAQYSASKLNKDFLWEAAELCAKLDKKLDAATFYEEFGTKYKPEAAQKRAWYKAAILHVAIKRYAFAVAAYEKELISLTNFKGSNAEKAKISKEIATIQRQYGQVTDAIGALDRYGKVTSNGDEILWTLAEKTELQYSLAKYTNAKENALKATKVNSSSSDGEKWKAKSRYFLAKIDSEEIKRVDFMASADVKKTLSETEKNYTRTKANATAGCPSASQRYCAIGSFDMAKLAEEIAKKVLDFQIPATLRLEEVEPMKARLSKAGSFYSEETKALALQASSATATNELDTETIERIKAFARPYRN
jgi:uncharacterized glyoxalase superfamily protein PhnB